MNLIPPNFDPQSILDPDARAIMADWWEEHGDDERAAILRGDRIYCRFEGGPKHGEVEDWEREAAFGGVFVREPATFSVARFAAPVTFATIARRQGGYRPRLTKQVTAAFSRYTERQQQFIATAPDIDHEGILTLEWQGWE